MDTEEHQEIKEPKQCHKKKYIIMIISAVCTIVCLCFVLLQWNIPFDMGGSDLISCVKSSDNLYYSEDTLCERAHKGDKENILADYHLLSEYLTEVCPQKVFHIDYFNYVDDVYYGNMISETDDVVKAPKGPAMIYYISQMVDGAIVDDTMFNLTVRDGKLIDSFRFNISKFVQDEPKLNSKISVEEVIRTAKGIAKDNEGVMKESISDVECFYELRYDDEEGFRYCVYFGNDGCLGTVAIDAETGKVLRSHFSDGLID